MRAHVLDSREEIPTFESALSPAIKTRAISFDFIKEDMFFPDKELGKSGYRTWYGYYRIRENLGTTE